MHYNQPLWDRSNFIFCSFREFLLMRTHHTYVFIMSMSKGYEKCTFEEKFIEISIT